MGGAGTGIGEVGGVSNEGDKYCAGIGFDALREFKTCFCTPQSAPDAVAGGVVSELTSAAQSAMGIHTYTNTTATRAVGATTSRSTALAVQKLTPITAALLQAAVNSTGGGAHI